MKTWLLLQITTMNESLPSYNKHQLLVGAVCWKYQTFASCKQRLVRARATTL